MAGSGVRPQDSVSPSDSASALTPAPATQSLREVSSGQAPITPPRKRCIFRRLAFILLRQVAAIVAPIITFALALALAIAPMGALIVAVWASGSALAALARLVMLTRAGQALTSPATPALLGTLDTAARVGFLAVGYLALIFALIFALITLMGGLFGRGWGRLYILPGVAFSVTALALMLLGALFAAPLVDNSLLPAAWLIPLILYALVDAVLVSGVLVDARPSRSFRAKGRRRALKRRRRVMTNSPERTGSVSA